MAVDPVDSWVEGLGSIIVGRCMEYMVTGPRRKIASGDNVSQESKVKEAGLVDGARREARTSSCLGTQQASLAECRKRCQAVSRQETGLMQSTLGGPSTHGEGISTQPTTTPEPQDPLNSVN